MSFDHLKSIYRSFDIRGAYPDELNEEETTKIGRSLVVLYEAKTVVIGHDYRPSSEALHQALIDGLTQQGANVITAGMVTTPMLYHAAGEHNADVSVMITGSHMATGFNGLKICTENVTPIGLEYGLDKVRDHVAAGAYPDIETTGSVQTIDITPSWRAHCKSLINFGAGDVTKVVLDPANMVGIKEIDTLTQFSELEVTTMYDEYDWNTPNHEANPMKLDTMIDLGKKVVETGSAIGVALDGDGDRIGLVDENGDPVPQDIVGDLITEELFARNGNTGAVVHDVRSSKHIAEVAEAAGGKAVPNRIGHTHIRRKMRAIDAVYGFELSGHHFFKDMHYSEAGIFPALLLIEIMRKEDKKLSELVAENKIYFHSSEINSEVTKKPEDIYTELRAAYPNARFDTTDGLTVEYDDWWFNTRPSANDPVMRLNLEADTKELMEAKRDEVLAVIRG